MAATAPRSHSIASARQRRASPAVSRVIAALERGNLDHPQPELVGEGPARIHGDLWAGNVLWGPSGVVLIDPAAHGAHAETDLAILAE